MPPRQQRSRTQCRFQLNLRRIGLIAWALLAGIGGTVATLYHADAIFGFGLLFLVVTSVVCTAIALTMDRWFGSVRW